MLTIKRPHRMYGMTLADVYFPNDNQWTDAGADIAIILQATEPITDGKPFNTLLIDLQQDDQTLLGQMHRNTRYKVRRSDDRDPVNVCFNDKPDTQALLQFMDFFDAFAQTKHLPTCNRDRLQGLADADALLLGTVNSDQTAEPLACHGHIIDRQAGRARLLYSASLFRNIDDSALRNLIGRANRLLHWRTMIQSRIMGLHTYDFGGLGDADEAQQRIAEFKLGFGGRQVTEYNATIGMTMAGKLALKTRQWLSSDRTDHAS